MLHRILITLSLLMAALCCEGRCETTLTEKARLFEADMVERFLLDGQALCKRQLPGPGRDYVSYNMPDNAYMTGIHTATLSMKYAVTGAPADREAALASLKALHLLCNVSGVPGLPARAAWPKDRPHGDDGVWRDSPDGVHVWRGDVSTDQVDGIIFGFCHAFDLVAGEQERPLIARDVAAIIDRISANGLRIVDSDGAPIRWGRYDAAHVKRREKMNALLWLQALKVAEHVTGDPKYASLYRQYAVDEGYADAAVEARRLLNPAMRGAVNHSDDVLLYLAYVPLLLLEKEPVLREKYLKSIHRSWGGNERFPGVKPEGNPFYAFVMARHCGVSDAHHPGIQSLRLFSPDMKWNRDTLERHLNTLGLQWVPAQKSPEHVDGQPVPMDRREKTWSAWVQDPYHSAGERDKDQLIEYNGHDYLLAYWMGRHYGFLSEKD